MDRAEISELYLRTGPLIFRRCLKLLGDPERARDAVQEVFVRATRHAARLRDDRGCLPWLYRVSTNVCLNALRGGRPAQRQTPFDEQALAPGGQGAEFLALSRLELLQLFEGFDEKTRHVVIYALVDGMTQAEVARVMGTSRRTVGKKLRAFLAQARRLAPEVSG